MPREVPAHYLRPNEAQWTPTCVAVLDTETRVLIDTEPQVLGLRLWCARMTDRRANKAGRQHIIDGSGTTRADLVAWIEAAMVGRDSVWLYVHNLSFDLAVTRLPLLLAARGWTITEAAISGNAPWLRLAKGRKHLTMVDSWSWLPMSLAEIGKAIGVAKPELPDSDDDESAWWQRCAGDVDVTSAAMLQLMDWWDRRALGRWTITGPASGWNAMRHTPTVERIVVDPDPEKVKWERRAIYGGRRGTWRIGQLSAGPFAEVDFEAAYPTVAANLPLPVKRSHSFESLPLDDWRLTSDRWSIIADVELDTDTALYPLRTDGGTFYPVGRFRTTLAGPEIAEAVSRGHLLAVGAGWCYRMGHALAPWATWCLATQRGEIEDTPPTARMVAKSWGRTVIGKWASRAPETVKWGPSPYPDWHVEDGWDHNEGTKGAWVHIAGSCWWTSRTGTPDNCFPAMLAFVESHTRVRLNRAVEALGGLTVIQCDTDGLMVDTRRLRAAQRVPGKTAAQSRSTGYRVQAALDDLADVVAPLRLRVKRSHDSLTVLGPQHLVASGERRYAGLSKAATDMGNGRFRVRLWPKLEWQMGHGDDRGYMRPMIEPTVAGPYPTGWLLDDGMVVPIGAMIDGDGRSAIVAWPVDDRSAKHAELADVQHPTLARVLDHWFVGVFGPLAKTL